MLEKKHHFVSQWEIFAKYQKLFLPIASHVKEFSNHNKDGSVRHDHRKLKGNPQKHKISELFLHTLATIDYFNSFSCCLLLIFKHSSHIVLRQYSKNNWLKICLFNNGTLIAQLFLIQIPKKRPKKLFPPAGLHVESFLLILSTPSLSPLLLATTPQAKKVVTPEVH